MARSYYARYRGVGGLMLGGVARSVTSRFAEREEAEHRLATAIEVNKDAGFEVDGEVYESNLPPEIFTHCGTGPSTSVGGKCFRCHKVLTKEDAVVAGYEQEVRQLGIAYGAHDALLLPKDDPDASHGLDWYARYRAIPIEQILSYIPVDRHPVHPTARPT